MPSVSNSLDPHQTQHFVRPDLDPNCLQRSLADDSSRLRGVQSHFLNKMILMELSLAYYEKYGTFLTLFYQTEYCNVIATNNASIILLTIQTSEKEN